MTLCGLSNGFQPGFRSFIMIAELQFFTHMNRSYVYKLIFFKSPKTNMKHTDIFLNNFHYKL